MMMHEVAQRKLPFDVVHKRKGSEVENVMHNITFGVLMSPETKKQTLVPKDSFSNFIRNGPGKGSY